MTPTASGENAGASVGVSTLWKVSGALEMLFVNSRLRPR